jgi:hypothetical protein
MHKRTKLKYARIRNKHSWGQPGLIYEIGFYNKTMNKMSVLVSLNGAKNWLNLYKS